MLLRKVLIFALAPVLMTVILTSCQSEQEISKAVEIAQNTIIADGHVDIPYRLRNNWEDISQRTESGDFDYVRATEGGLDAPFMSIYIPARYQETGGAKALADSLINMVVGITEDHSDKFALANNTDDIRNNFEKDLISLPMGMENGAPIENDIENVKYFFDRGIRYITLTHAKDNHISDSSYDTLDTHGGLSDFGFDVVTEMNRLGIMVDVSHLSDSAFYDVMRTTSAPVIASHSSCRHFTPGWERNMSDDMIQRLSENGGVIMINFGSAFLSQESRESGQKVREEINGWLEDNNLDSSDPEARAYIKNYFEENYKYATVTDVADHIDHVVELVGIDYVGLGSDFDGVGFTLPEGLKDASEMPNLIDELLKRGYSEQDISKILYENLFRVWDEVDRIAQDSGSGE